ncbi:MAG: TolC family protein [Planctomycetota bacterium]|nr:TolC family protein [Planctomycetota bacterium]
MRNPILYAIALSLTGLASCLLTPDGLDDERDAALDAGAPYAKPHDERELPALPEPATDRDLLRRAFLANGGVEASWHAWRAALAEVEVASAWPSGMFEVEVERAFQGGSSGFDQTSVLAMFDPLLEWPSKPKARGEAALAEARAARERFRAAALALRADVLASAARLRARQAEVSLRGEQQALYDLEASLAERSVATGGLQLDLARIQLEARLSEDMLQRAVAETARERATLNGLLDRAPRAKLDLAEGGTPRPWPGSEDDLLVRLADANPELRELAHSIEGGARKVDLARQAYVPDVSPRVGFTGSMEQFVGASIGLPANLAAVRSEIERTSAGLEELRAFARQRQAGLAAEITAEFVLLQDAERQSRLYTDEIGPLADRFAASAGSAYATGGATQRDWIESQRAALDARLALAEARAAREEALVRIEALAGIEIAELAGTEEVAREVQ